MSRVGVALVLHLKDREQPIYGDVTGELDGEDTFDFEVWGGPVLTIELSNVKSAIAPDLGFKEYREVCARQRVVFAAEKQVAPLGGGIGGFFND